MRLGSGLQLCPCPLRFGTWTSSNSVVINPLFYLHQQWAGFLTNTLIKHQPGTRKEQFEPDLETSWHSAWREREVEAEGRFPVSFSILHKGSQQKNSLPSLVSFPVSDLTQPTPKLFNGTPLLGKEKQITISHGKLVPAPSFINFQGWSLKIHVNCTVYRANHLV